MPVVILGLGPGAWRQVTLEAKAVLDGATEVYLRTTGYPIVPYLPPHLRIHSFDALFKDCPSLETACEAIVEELCSLARRPMELIYAVPGHPLVGEAVVRNLLPRCQAEGIEVRVVSGMSFLGPMLSSLDADPLSQGLQVADALDPRVDPALPAVISQLSGQRIISLLKTKLLELYPQNHLVSLLIARDEGQYEACQLPLERLGQPLSEWPVCLYLPPLTAEQNLSSFAALEHIVAKLRAPDGCPWDREQTHTSLKPFLIEEAYEVLQALDEGDAGKFCEELGDLLLQVVLHAQIATEAKEFEIGDVIRSISTKLIHRHPHVFGGSEVADARHVRLNWEALKREERDEGASLLSTIPEQMPSLAYSQAIQQRAARAGFDWKEFEGILEKLVEELGELRQAEDQQQKTHEFGDILFALADAGRWLEVDLEQALRQASEKFCRRFSYMEEACHRRGVLLSSLSFEEQNELWDEAKQNLKLKSRGAGI